MSAVVVIPAQILVSHVKSWCSFSSSCFDLWRGCLAGLLSFRPLVWPVGRAISVRILASGVGRAHTPPVVCCSNPFC